MAFLPGNSVTPKVAEIPEGATMEERLNIAANIVPDERQLQWQQRPLTAFLHFGMNTFTGREWGDGTEDPALFNPDALDTDQWVRTLKDAGFEMVILTAKHHDGFCLWPTATTTHSVASSPWRDGKGDVVRDLRRSCDKYGMKLGLYLSPWDRNAACYGDSERYNDMFVAQLTELLTQYGTIDEVWFDGACGEGPNGKKQEYDWLRFRETMRSLQPNAVLAITGDDVRWVGNEGGLGRETEWSVTPLMPSIFPESDSINASLGIDAISTDIGSRELLAKASRLYWWPSEVDVSIRPGWFYHDSEEPKSLRQLTDIYLQSVGRNSVLLLNVPPDYHGLIARPDSTRLMELHRWVETGCGTNLLSKTPATINAVTLSEDITRGQRVEEFDVVGYVDGTPQLLGSGTTIGYNRIITFPQTNVDSVAVKVKASRAEPFATVEGIHYLPPVDESATGGAEDPSKVIIPGNTRVIASQDKYFVYLTLDSPQTLTGMEYIPSADGAKIYRYTVMTYSNGQWQVAVPATEFGNIQASPTPRTVKFSSPSEAQLVLMIVSQTMDGELQADDLILKFFNQQ